MPKPSSTKAIPISPGLILEIDPNAEDKPLFCLRALDADNQKVFICYDEMEVLIKALGDALAEPCPEFIEGAERAPTGAGR